MTNFNKKRIFIKFCFKLKVTALKTQRMLQKSFENNALRKSKTYLWYKRFKDGRTAVANKENDRKKRQNLKT